MKARDVTVMACKILSIYAIILGTLELPYVFYHPARMVVIHGSSYIIWSVARRLLMALIRFVIGILLWIWSGRIASMVNVQNDSTVSETVVTARDLAAIGIVLAGVLIIKYAVHGLSQCAACLRVESLFANIPLETRYGVDWRQGFHFDAIEGLTIGLTGIVLGLFLLVRPRTVLGWVDRRSEKLEENCE